jgi:anti-sigma regulatory factor (Ser/Thr protein kinase)/serine/threonine protein phosphatase PrpC
MRADYIHLEVTARADVPVAGHRARIYAAVLGFDQQTVDKIALIVNELGTNLVKHAGGGTLTFRAGGSDAGRTLEIQAEDAGPGIGEREWAVTDGCSTSGGLGVGLGTIRRLVDDLEITSPVGQHGGTRIVCRLARRRRPPDNPRRTDIGVATRPRIGEDSNGDAFVVLDWGAEALVGVIDGLGHGTRAHDSAQIARQYVEDHHQQPLEDLFRGVDRACRATRGVVMALARINVDLTCLSFASVGNIEARLFNGQDRARLVARRGVLGMGIDRPVVTELYWDGRSVLILHSDGVTAHWDWDSIAHLLPKPSSVVAQQLLNMVARSDDDASVLVAKAPELLHVPQN